MKITSRCLYTAFLEICLTSSLTPAHLCCCRCLRTAAAAARPAAAPAAAQSHASAPAPPSWPIRGEHHGHVTRSRPITAHLPSPCPWWPWLWCSGWPGDPNSLSSSCSTCRVWISFHSTCNITHVIFIRSCLFGF